MTTPGCAEKAADRRFLGVTADEHAADGNHLTCWCKQDYKPAMGLVLPDASLAAPGPTGPHAGDFADASR